MVNVPNPEAVFNDLVPVLTAAYEAFEFGTYKAREYFEKEKSRMDFHLAAHLARFNAMKVFHQKGHDVSNGEDRPDYVIKPLSNSGIYLARNQYRIRMLKSKDGDLPHPGHSQRKQRYYNQDFWQMTFDFPSYIEPPQECINLVLLWRVDNSYGLKSFSLAFPRAAGATRDSVLVYWNKIIPMEFLHNILISSPTVESPEPDDLPILLNTEIEIERDAFK